MFKTRGKMNGQTPPKRGALPLLLHSQFNTSLWFMKTRNDAASVMKKSVRKIGVRSQVHDCKADPEFIAELPSSKYLMADRGWL